MRINFIIKCLFIICICLNANFSFAKSEAINITDMQIHKVTPIADEKSEVVEKSSEYALIGDKILSAKNLIEDKQSVIVKIEEPLKLDKAKVVKKTVVKKKTLTHYTFRGAKAKFISAIVPSFQQSLEVEPVVVKVEQFSNKIIKESVPEVKIEKDFQSEIVLLNSPPKKMIEVESINEEEPQTTLLLKDISEKPIKETSVIDVIVSLMIVIAMIYLLAYVFKYLKKINPNMFPQAVNPKNSKEFKHVSSNNLGQGKNVHLVEINGKQVVIGSSNSDDNLLNEVSANIDDIEALMKNKELAKNINEENLNIDEEFNYQNEKQYEVTHSDMYKEYLN